MIRSFGQTSPQVGEGAYVDESAQVIGDVELGPDSSVWMNSVVRGDVNWIRVGARSNIQDLCLAHVSHRTHPLQIGAGVTIGHHAVVHGCTIHDDVLVGIGARVLDGAVVEREVIVAAGCLVTPGTQVPTGSVIMGVPGRVVRAISQQEREHIRDLAARYADLARSYTAAAAS